MPLFTDAAPRLPSPIIRLQAGQTFQPDPGWYWLQTGPGSELQRYDSRAGIWRYAGDRSPTLDIQYFDGVSVRLANTTGCPIAAVVTTAGSGYTSAPTVAASAGASVWTAIVGGAVSTAAVIAVAGSGYLYPPLLWIDQPPNPGVQATGYTTISGGTISAVTIDNQGAGYLTPPNAVLINDFRDTAGYGGQVNLALTGAQTVTAVVCTNHGNPITSGTVPTLSFSGGGGSSAAATAVVDWAVQSVSVTTAGAGYTSAAASAMGVGAGGFISSTPAYVGTASTTDLVRWREAKIALTTNASGGLASAAIIDPGRYQSIPTAAIYAAQTPTTAGVLALTMGGVASTVFLSPAQY